MSKKVSVICCIYNSYPVVRRCLEAFFSVTPHEDVELILVDNNPPDRESSRYIMQLAKEHHDAGRSGFVRVLKTEKNLGCHGGWNFGYGFATGEYVCKLDDDTVILTPEWPKKMYAALEKFPEMAILSADIDAKQANKYVMADKNGYQFEIAMTGVVGFSLAMFRRSDIEKWGPMKTGAYRAAGGKTITTERLYGGEEVYYAGAAKAENRSIAHYPAVKCHHLDNAERHPDYALWKRVYGYHGWTDKDMETWLESGQHVYHYCACIAQELNAKSWNDALLRDWTHRLGQIGEPKHVELIEHVIAKTKNRAVIETAEDAVRNIMGRVKK